MLLSAALLTANIPLAATKEQPHLVFVLVDGEMGRAAASQL